jgi:mannose-6-phosphate isomerase-like protein (cupin superfamily)
MEKVNIAEKLNLFDDHWSPKIVGGFDEYDIKLVKFQGEFVWHKHDDEDEVFLVIDGAMDIEFRDRTVHLGAGEFFVVPKGAEHKPFAENECSAMLLERKGVVNTGDASPGALTRDGLDRI